MTLTNLDLVPGTDQIGYSQNHQLITLKYTHRGEPSTQLRNASQRKQISLVPKEVIQVTKRQQANQVEKQSTRDINSLQILELSTYKRLEQQTVFKCMIYYELWTMFQTQKKPKGHDNEKEMQMTMPRTQDLIRRKQRPEHMR